MKNIWPKNLTKSKPKRAILTSKWNFERSLIMQLYALDRDGEPVLAARADRREQYFCMECACPLGLRQGEARRPHFYHFRASEKCRLSAKGMIHLNLQQYLCDLLPEAKMEQRFKKIGRIADVAWLPKKLIYEIQCSPISAEEVLGRIADYRSIGFEVVWILHDKKYNRYRQTPAENALKENTHYFTNFDRASQGIVYDQYEIVQKGRRALKLSPLPVDLSRPAAVMGNEAAELPLIKQRSMHWRVQFAGDLLDRAGDSKYLEKARHFERKQQRAFSFKHLLHACLNWYRQWIDSLLFRCSK